MTIDFLRQLGIFAVLCLAQALVFNRIHLFGCATPLIYIYDTETRAQLSKMGNIAMEFFHRIDC